MKKSNEISCTLIDKTTAHQTNDNTIFGSHARQLKHMLKKSIVVENIRRAFDNVRIITSKEQALRCYCDEEKTR